MKYDIPNFFVPIEWWWQRRTRGWDDRDLWSLDHTIARFVLPRLIELKKVKPGVPMDFYPEGCTHPTAEEDAEASRKMHEVLDKMIYSMQAILDDKRPGLDSKDPEVWVSAEERIQEGFDLFGKYFQMLWA